MLQPMYARAAERWQERSAPAPQDEHGERWWQRMAGTMFGVGPCPTFADSDIETELALDIGVELAMLDLEHGVVCTEPPLSDVDVLWGVDR